MFVGSNTRRFCQPMNPDQSAARGRSGSVYHAAGMSPAFSPPCNAQALHSLPRSFLIATVQLRKCNCLHTFTTPLHSWLKFLPDRIWPVTAVPAIAINFKLSY